MKQRIRIVLAALLLFVLIPAASRAATPVGPPVKLVLGIMIASDAPYAKGGRDFAKMVEERSGGSITVEVFTDGVLGNEIEMWEGIQVGTLDMTVISPGNVSNYIPAYSFYDLPYLFESYAHRDAVLNAPVAKKLDKLLEDEGGMITLGQFGGTGRYLIARRANATKMADVAGLKMRIQASNLVLRTWEKFGTVPITVAYGETYSALQTGVADAAESELFTFITQKWCEPCKFLTKTEHMITTRPFIIGKDKFNSLTPEQQKIILECGAEASRLAVQYEREDETNGFVELERLGVTITELPDKDVWIAATESLREEFCAEYGLSEILKEVKAVQWK